jgi:putative flavoprotein involved in K+ transport
MGFYAKDIGEFDDADAVRFRANHYVTGRDGGHDIDLRAFARDGMRLYGRLTGVDAGAGGGTLRFAPDLAANLDAADAVSESIKDAIDAHIAARGVAAPEEARYVPVWAPEAEPDSLAAGRLAAVVWCTGFGQDNRWVEVPVFDGRGYPTHSRGVTRWPGLYVLGLPWQHTWGSGRFCGVGADAEHLADRIEQHGRGAASGRGWAEDLRWLAGTPTSTYSDDWTAPRTFA